MIEIIAIVIAYPSALYTLRYVRRFYTNGLGAFLGGAAIFLIIETSFTFVLGFLLPLIFSSLLSGQESDVIGILTEVFLRIFGTAIMTVPTILALAVGYKHMQGWAISTVDVSSVRTPLDSTHRVSNTISLPIISGIILVFLTILPWWTTITFTTAPLLASRFHQPQWCLWMPEVAFDSGRWQNLAPGVACLKRAQTDEEYYARCDLMPEAVREPIANIDDANSPYQDCIMHNVQVTTRNATSSMLGAVSSAADTCGQIKDLERRATCLLPYTNTSAQGVMCAAVFNSLDQGFFDGIDAVIIGRCLDKQTVNEKMFEGRPIWFNFHVASGYKLGNHVSVKRDDILQWLKSINVNPNARTATSARGSADKSVAGQTFLLYLLDAGLQSQIWLFVTADDIKALISFGVDPRIKDISGWSAMDYAIKWGNIDAVEVLLPYFKGYAPRQEAADFFLKEICDYQADTGKCFSIWDTEQAAAERARVGFQKLGFIQFK
ncbi:ankyrin repeat domain-containing protein [Candidatus Kaiserbacteria bacterium]|nr:ankyrin repeat domain-containing protein [Candidatus Kaiserbacteria bacterium]